MLSLLPKEFDSALLGYAESGRGRAIVLPVYDEDLLYELIDSSKNYTREELEKWDARDDAPLLLKRMSTSQVEEQSSLYDFEVYKANPSSVLGIVSCWGKEECFCYDLKKAAGGDIREAQSIIQHDLPGRDFCFLLGTGEEDLRILKEKAYRYIY